MSTGMGGKPSNNGSGNLSGSMSGNGTNLAGSNGTLEEKRNENGGADVAGIIGAGAGGLDSITNFITSVTGKGGSNTNNSNETNYIPPPENKANPLLIGGIAAGVLVLIIVLILTKNGQAKQ